LDHLLRIVVKSKIIKYIPISTNKGNKLTKTDG